MCNARVEGGPHISLCRSRPQTKIRSYTSANRLLRESEAPMSKHRRACLTLIKIVVATIQAVGLIAPMQSSLAGGKPPSSASVSTTVAAGHVVMSLWTGTGPYFLSELLPVHVSLRNTSHRSLAYIGWPTDTPCVPALSVSVVGGSPPLYVLPSLLVPSCPGSPLHWLAPGQTLTVALLIPLTASGHVTLVAQTYVPTASRSDLSALKGRWPSLTITITINAHIPPNRTFRLHHYDSLVAVSSPPGARPHLLYQYQVASLVDSTGNFVWEPLSSGVVHDTRDASWGGQWLVMVSAPGYAITTAVYGAMR